MQPSCRIVLLRPEPAGTPEHAGTSALSGPASPDGRDPEDVLTAPLEEVRSVLAAEGISATASARARRGPLPAESAESARHAQAGGPGYAWGVLEAGDSASVPQLRQVLDPLRRRWAEEADQTFLAVVPGGMLSSGPRMLIMDVDSTLIEQEVVDELAVHAGVAAEVADITARAMAGELDFRESLHARVATLAGLPTTVMSEVGSRLVLSPGARQLVQGFLDRGDPVCVVSGGFLQIVEPLAGELGLTHARANVLGVAGDAMTGRVVGAVVDAAAKEASLGEWAADHSIAADRVVAVGDGANDLRMLATAGLGVAFDAKPALREAADADLGFRRLDAVLDLLDLRRV